MTIRIMKIEDYESVYALWLSCSGMGLNNIDDSEDGIRRLLSERLSPEMTAGEDIFTTRLCHRNTVTVV